MSTVLAPTNENRYNTPPKPADCIMFNPEEFRALFPALQSPNLVYLDSAASCQTSQVVLDSLLKHSQTSYANVHRASYQRANTATQAYEQSRQQVAQLINANNNEIVWTSGATQGINLLAYGLHHLIKPGDEILLSELEHHSNLAPWQRLAQQCQAKLTFIPINQQLQLDLSQLDTLINANTKIISLNHVSNSLGCINPVAQIIKYARANSTAKVIIDGAQASSHLQLDMQTLDCDFYVFSAHKFYGPNALGVLYGKYKELEQLAAYQLGGEMVAQVSYQQADYQPPPLKFEAGTPAILPAIAFGEWLKYWQQLDISELHSYEQTLLAELLRGLSTINEVELLGCYAPEERISLVSFNVQDQHPSDVAMLLDEQNIALRSGNHCTMPLFNKLGLHGSLRVSLAAYNNQADIQLFLAALKRAIAILC